MFGNPQVVTWASKFHKAPVLFIISNNRGYSTGTTQVLRSYPEGYAAKAQDVTGGWFDPCPTYSGEAAASGAYGEKVTDPAEVGPAIQRGLQAVREGAPGVVDMWMPANGPGEVGRRRGGLFWRLASAGWRRVRLRLRWTRWGFGGPGRGWRGPSTLARGDWSAK